MERISDSMDEKNMESKQINGKEKMRREEINFENGKMDEIRKREIEEFQNDK